MALTKETVVDKIEVLEMGQLQIRTAIRIMENGTQLSQAFHRHVLAPADDLTNENAKVVAIANATWTPEVISAYEAMMAALQAERNTG